MQLEHLKRYLLKNVTSRPPTFDLLEQTATPTSGIHAMF